MPTLIMLAHLHWGHAAAFTADTGAARHLRTVLAEAALEDLRARFARHQLGPLALESVKLSARRGTTAVYRCLDARGTTQYLTVRYAGESAAIEAARLFPTDPRLPQLPALLSEADTRAALPAGVLGGIAPGMTWMLMSYLPGSRATLGQSWPGLRLVAKCHAHAPAAHELLGTLWRVPGRGFRMPEPVAVSAPLATRWETLCAGLRCDVGPLDAGTLAAILRALVALHAAPCLAGARRLDGARLLRRVGEQTLPLARLLTPAWVDALEALETGLARAALELPRPQAVLLHGDLHTSNVLMHAGEAVLVDLDSLSVGDVEADLALFGTRLLLVAMVQGGEVGSAARLVETLPEAYRAAGGREVSEPLYAWHVALALVGRQLRTCLRHLHPHVDGVAARLVPAAQRILGHAKATAELIA